MSSVHEDLPFPHFTAYCASKGGPENDVAQPGHRAGAVQINVNNIAPGAIETPINTKLLHDQAKLTPCWKISRSIASASPPTLPARSFSSLQPTPITSPARRWSSTAG